MTKEGVLKNLGKVLVTAEPGTYDTAYSIEIEKPVFKKGLLGRTSRQTGLYIQEEKMFGRLTSTSVDNPRHITMHIPSTDPNLCSKFISDFLKWLDNDYWNALNLPKQYEQIEF
jgi:hypothetical protein